MKKNVLNIFVYSIVANEWEEFKLLLKFIWLKVVVTWQPW